MSYFRGLHKGDSRNQSSDCFKGRGCGARGAGHCRAACRALPFLYLEDHLCLFSRGFPSCSHPCFGTLLATNATLTCGAQGAGWCRAELHMASIKAGPDSTGPVAKTSGRGLFLSLS